MSDFKLALLGDLQKTLKEEKSAIARGTRGGMEALAALGKKRLRQQIVQSGLGNRLAKTWRDRVYPAKRVETFEPAGIIWSNAPHIVRAFNDGKTIRSKVSWDKARLAIPTDFAPVSRKRGARRKRMSLEEFVAEFGDILRPIPAPGSGGRVLYLVADKGFRKGRGKRGGSRKVKAGGRIKDEPVLMYVAVKSVRLRPRLDIDSVERALARLAPDYLGKHLAKELGNEL